MPDPVAALEQLIDLGFTRVLSSGRAARAEDGADEIRRTVERAAGRIEVIAGGGITPANVTRLVAAAGVRQVHGSFMTTVSDRSTAGNTAVRLAADRVGACGYRATDEHAVRATRVALDRTPRS